MNLSNLKKNESGVISAIRLSGSIKRRLSDMGMTPGATVKMLRLAPLGDPVEFRVLNCNIGIRKKDAEKIFIHKSLLLSAIRIAEKQLFSTNSQAVIMMSATA